MLCPVTPHTATTTFLVEEWQSIPQDEISNLVRSIPQRCQPVIGAHGGHTILGFDIPSTIDFYQQ